MGKTIKTSKYRRGARQDAEIAALRQIQEANGGVLRPADVVEAARPPEHPLHGRFEWDDSRAAHEHRLWQARELIQIYITILPQAPDKPIRMFVSLKADRRMPGGGYRLVEDVLKDPVARARMLAEALEDLRVYEEKYRLLEELEPIFAAAKEVRARRSRKADAKASTAGA